LFLSKFHFISLEEALLLFFCHCCGDGRADAECEGRYWIEALENDWEVVEVGWSIGRKCFVEVVLRSKVHR